MQTLFRLPAVVQITGRSKPSIYKDVKEGRFPSPIKIGDRAVAWVSTDIEKWVEQRIAASQCGGGA